MKKINLLFLLVILLSFSTVNAKVVDADDILYNSYVIGTYLYTVQDNEIMSTVGRDDVIIGDDMNLTTPAIMLGATSIEDDTYDNMIIYYKDFFDEWSNAYDGSSIEVPESFEITHVNGICIEEPCGGRKTTDTITVSLDLNDGSIEDDTNYTSDNSYTLSCTIADENCVTPESTPTRDGYTFKGWSLTESDVDTDLFQDNADLSNVIGNSTSITLHAIWEVKNYDITYDLNGGTIDSNNPSTYNVETETFEFNKPTKVGYIFNGWKNGDDYITEITSGSTGDISLMADWKEITYTIHCDENEIFEGNYENSKNTTLESLESNGNSVFAGWKTESSNIIYPAKLSLDNVIYNNLDSTSITLTPVWKTIESNTVTVTYNVDGIEYSFIVNKGETIENLALNKEGYTFKGWSKTPNDSDNLYNFETEVTENTTLYAIFDEIKFKVTYDINADDVEFKSPSTEECTYSGSCYVISDVPTRTGYIFGGWGYNVSALTGEEDSYIIYGKNAIIKGYTGEIKLTAIWLEPKTYKITYNLNGGYASDISNIVTYANVGDEVDLSGFVPEYKDGKATFKEWFDGTDTYSSTDKFTMPSNSITLTAKWSVTVRFVFNGEEAVSSTIDKDSVLDKNNLEIDEYGVISNYDWYTDEDLEDEFDLDSEVTESITLYSNSW